MNEWKIEAFYFAVSDFCTWGIVYLKLNYVIYSLVSFQTCMTTDPFWEEYKKNVQAAFLHIIKVS